MGGGGGVGGGGVKLVSCTVFHSKKNENTGKTFQYKTVLGRRLNESFNFRRRRFACQFKQQMTWKKLSPKLENVFCTT